MKRFWDRVEKTETCWIWKGVLLNGYGRLGYKGKHVRAHRLSWFLTHGEWVDSDTHVLHKCDNRACVNPDHLFLGTNYDNVKDKMMKGRSGFKLTVENVVEIKKLLEAGEKRSTIAKKFNVDCAQIRRIDIGENWSHIK